MRSDEFTIQSGIIFPCVFHYLLFLNKNEIMFMCYLFLLLSRTHLMYTCGVEMVNPLTPNDHYSGRTAPLTSKRCILYIYSTNIGTEYFKHGVYSPFFSLFKMQFVS